MNKIALIIFPGTNCELEAFRACERAGLKPSFVRWNADPSILKDFDAFLLPGGFSYEDRGRSGVIAAKEAIMVEVIAAAMAGKPVLGICNGAQMLVEAGLVPGIHRSLNPHDTANILEMSLAWNERVQDQQIIGKGYYNDWIYVRADVPKGRSFFNRFGTDIVMRIAVANGEGRFITASPQLLDLLIADKQTVFRYCDQEGNIVSDFPVNPNGALYNLAGICNPEGNVLALMPHPERSLSGQPIFDSLAEALQEKQSLFYVEKAQLREQAVTLNFPSDITLAPKPSPDFSITVELIITDNEERTLENTFKKQGFYDLELKRRLLYNFYLNSNAGIAEDGIKSLITQLIESGELINLHKEIPKIQIGNTMYIYEKNTGLIEEHDSQPITNEYNSFYVIDRDNYAGACVLKKLMPYLSDTILDKVEKGILWTVKQNKNESSTPEGLQKLLQTHLFHNPNAMELVAF